MKKRVVVIGSGFGGLFATQALKQAEVDVTVIAKTGQHLFQPLLYQLATGILSEGEVAPSMREVLARQKNAEVVLGEVYDIDLKARTVSSHLIQHDLVTPYDYLIVASGADLSYFGNDQFSEFAPGMKSIDDALELRGRIFGAFELAEAAQDDEERKRNLTFVIVGAGPTGVEIAGQIAELAHRTLRHEFRRINPEDANIILVDAGDAVLPTFGKTLGRKAQNRLEKIGVDISLGQMVVNVDANGVDIKAHDGTKRRIEALTKVWAAGVSASPLARILAEGSGAPLDRAGRITPQDDLSLPGHPEVFVVGDMVSLNKLPGLAPVAIQGGQHAAAIIRAEIENTERPGAFTYKDKGTMAIISRFDAVAQVGSVRLTGFVAWMVWLSVHLFYIIGFKSRITTLLHWAVSFIGSGRSERVITEQQVFGRVIRQQHAKSLNPPGKQNG